MNLPALLDRAADRFNARMDTKVDSMTDRPVMDRLSVLEKTSCSTRSGPSSQSDTGGSEQCCWRYHTCGTCSSPGNQGVVFP